MPSDSTVPMRITAPAELAVAATSFASSRLSESLPGSAPACVQAEGLRDAVVDELLQRSPTHLLHAGAEDLLEAGEPGPDGPS